MSKKITYTGEPMSLGERVKDFLPSPSQMVKRGTTTDAVEILHRRYFEGNTKRLALLEEARADAEIARKASTLRIKEGLTQAQLARRIRVPVQTIRALEEADYDGDGLALLGRIARAVGKKMEIRFVAIRSPKVRNPSHEHAFNA